MQPARRYNQGKPRMGLIPMFLLPSIRELTATDVLRRSSFLDQAIDNLSHFLLKNGTEDQLTSAIEQVLLAAMADKVQPGGVSGPSIALFNSVLEDLAWVYTRGAEKYTDRDPHGNVTYDGTFNWSLGMSWLSVGDSAMRHLVKARTEPLDYESGLPHLGHALWGLLTLMLYVDEHPEYNDTRFIPPVPVYPVGYDIDGVLADFTTAFVSYILGPECNWTEEMFEQYARGTEPASWNEPFFRLHFAQVIGNESFWANIPPLITPEEMVHMPAVYITSRPVANRVTEEWLDRHGFPKAPVINVWGTDDKYKVNAVLQSGVKLFIDDSLDNFTHINNAGVPCLLMTRSHNDRYDVGTRRTYVGRIITGE